MYIDKSIKERWSHILSQAMHATGLTNSIPLTLYLLVSSADNLCKQFEPRSGPT